MMKICEVGWIKSENDKRIVNVTGLAGIVQSTEKYVVSEKVIPMNKKNAGHTMFGHGLVLKFKYLYSFSGYV